MPDATIIPFELPLPQVLPTIEGNVDYRQFRDQLLRIDSLLVTSGLETRLMEKDLDALAGSTQKGRRQGPTKPPAPLPARAALQHRSLAHGRGLSRLCHPLGR